MSWDAFISRMSDADFDLDKGAIPLFEWRALASSDSSLLLVQDEPRLRKPFVADSVADENDRIVQYVWIGDPPMGSIRNRPVLWWAGKYIYQ